MHYFCSVLIFCLSSVHGANILDNFHPQSPQPPPAQSIRQQTQPQTQQQIPNARTSDGGEINPNFNENTWNRSAPLLTDLPAYKPSEWFPSLKTESPVSTGSLGQSSACPTGKPLNILHLGTGNGFVSLALAVFTRPSDSVLSLDDTANNFAVENIRKDGKEIFLRRLSFNQVMDLSTAPQANNQKYDLIVSSKSINQLTHFPRSLKDALVPRGVIIYPEEAGNERRLKVAKLEEYGNLVTLKTA